MQRSAIGILSIAAAVCVSCGRTGLDTAAMKPTDRSVPAYRAPGDWIAAEAIPFSPDSPESFNAAVAGLVEELDGRVELLGIGEPLHGGEGFLLLRNRLFQRLAEAHGFGAIAVESDFFRGRLVDEFVSGRGPASY
ncbi:MAG: erythromycin esterase family protein, partial [Chlamydiae bacterium]|nr:erythromycin esterase family protein [Chlamydiota bacterium]